MGHGQRPRAEQKVEHPARHFFQVGARTQLKGNLVGLRLPLFGKAQGLHQLVVALGFQLILFVPAVSQLGQGHAEGLRVVNGQAVERIEGAGHRLEKCQKLGAELVVVLEAALGHALDETPARMSFVIEKAWVHHGQAQQRRLQRHNGLAHRGQQPGILRHLVDQLAHQLQPQHLPHLPGFLLELGAEKVAFPGAAVRPPHRLVELAALIDKALGAVDGRQLRVAGMWRVA